MKSNENIDVDALIARVLIYKADHELDGWPAVQMSFLWDMARALMRQQIQIERYEAKLHLLQREQSRFGNGKERTLLCDILANGQMMPDPKGKRYPSANTKVRDATNEQ